ncbi:hypothetical protein JCGZ_21899 [Jatropha curcas]|uniref:Bifunctional inhibitor/plant lipid transfer protein/seed storage helical domain-containing protein n=1 Tax=Jatropha curcas TaxID=180498 RepID=A0A067JF68_JATCU|nr:non-specific lipid-transfer protein-like protein At2g13820 [Jatropha curcas]KDP21428.1 hypothetical protein JCGZ_21899 [Jatropha curcas]
MASKGIHIGLVLVLVGMLYGGAMAQSGCSNVLTSLAPCLNYVTGNTTTPSSSCCSQLASVVQSSPQCICSLLNNSIPSLGININQTQALSLPGACKVQTPPISQCKAANAPATSAAPPATSAASPSPTTSATSPAASPSGSPNETPEPAITPTTSNVPSSSSGSGSKTVPSTNGTSDGSIRKAPIHLMLFAFFILWCGSAFSKF